MNEDYELASRIKKELEELQRTSAHIPMPVATGRPMTMTGSNSRDKSSQQQYIREDPQFAVSNDVSSIVGKK